MMTVSGDIRYGERAVCNDDDHHHYNNLISNSLSLILL